jgi:hypothetical protein
VIIAWTAFTILLNVIAGLDQYAQSERKEQDDKLYTYCLYRLLVICPHCRIAFEVTDLAEQMNVEWECDCCHNTFVEHATHTTETP